MINKKRLIASFKQLVRIDSISLREGKVIDYLEKRLKSLGIKSRRIGKVIRGETGNLAAFLPGEKLHSPCILLNAHVDTVAPGRNIKPVEKNGFITSNGETILGADNKAGVAAILEIIETLKEKKLDHPPLRVIFTVGEEIGLVGAKALPREEMRADFALVLDGGDINIVVNKAPSQYNLAAVVIGKAAHAGIHPEEGINAIKTASEAIARMRLGRIDKETTANIGIISGGKATNIIPEEVEVKGEARSHNRKKLEKQIKHMKSRLAQSCARHGAGLKLDITKTYKAFDIDPDSPLLALTVSAMKEMGINPLIMPTGGGSDANVFNEKGIPAIILGVGADHVHTKNERLNRVEFIKGTEMVLNIIRGAGCWEKYK